MDAVEFFEVKKRMCLGADCENCVLTNNCVDIMEENHDYKTEVELVEKWAEENPVPKYTYLDDLLSKFPETRMKVNGFPDVCINVLYSVKINCFSTTCEQCWNREYTK